MNENPDKSTNNEQNEVFTLLNESQWRFVTAMVQNPSFNKKEAAAYIGLEPNTVYKWPDYVDQAIDLARLNIHNAALEMRKQAVLQAVAVKVQLLNSDDENIRSKAASEIIEWELGKALQSIDTNVSGTLKHNVNIRQLPPLPDDTLDEIIHDNG